MAGVRRDVATLGQGWDNQALLHYAQAMRELDKLPISDRNSWKFLGAMHGFDRETWIAEEVITSADAVPADLTDDTYGNQCQHGSWYFLSWHRAYLFTFEEIVAAKVKELTGEDWALPYWNYLDATNAGALRVPAAFLADTFVDGQPNPLRKYPRRPGLTQLQPGPFGFSLAAMAENDFQVGNNGGIGFGGGVTGDFVQFANWTGDLESNPHNTVHGLVGGGTGFMGNALLAGLDPLFWLHHCNIDRLWEAWMHTSGKTMVRDPRWLNGPADRAFLMPALGGGEPGRRFTSRDTLPSGAFHRGYDDLTKGTGVTPGAAMMTGVSMGSSESQSVEPIGANAAVVRVGAAPAPTTVNLEPAAAAEGMATMGATTPGQKVTRIYLALESVRGNAPSPLLDVYVNVPDTHNPEQHPECLAGSLTLFGLNVASKPDGPHAGNGLGYTLDITDLAQRLSASGDFNPDELRVTLVPRDQISDAMPVTVDRVTVLKRTGVVS